MKRLLLSGAASAALAVGSANAADLGRPPSALPPISAYTPFSWTGWYIGGNLGVAWTQGNVSDSFGDSFGNSQQVVFSGGGQVGANYQVNWLVVGGEAVFDWLSNDHNSSNSVFIPGVGALQVSANDRWITTAAARVGVATNNWLFYAKGGGGWVGTNNFTLTNVTTAGSISGSNNRGDSGWLVGAGIEWAFAPNWAAKIEYNFLGLNDSTFTVPVGALHFPAGDVFTTGNRDLQMLTVGINYLFNWQ
jgi:outer membrane immunogenic protein